MQLVLFHLALFAAIAIATAIFRSTVLFTAYLVKKLQVVFMTQRGLAERTEGSFSVVPSQQGRGCSVSGHTLPADNFLQLCEKTR